MQHILIPTDFSRNAWNATEYALRFFQNEEITFHFLHIDISLQKSNDEELYLAGFTLMREVSEGLKGDMEDWMLKTSRHCSNSKHTMTHFISQAPFVDGIREYIEKNEIDFMVMGTKGASGLKEITIGSKTGAVITRVKCPILVIPEQATFKKPIHIGFPTDFNLAYNQRVIQTLQKISKMFHSSVKVLRVAQTQKPLDNFQNNNRDFLKESLMDIPHSFHVIEDPNLEKALQSFVTTMKIDMVAMIAKNLNFFQRILFRPQVTQISYHMQIPFLVLHE